MSEDKYYYDYSHYYDSFEFNVTSETPGVGILLITAAYTAICIVIGFLFQCRKKKWRKSKGGGTAKSSSGKGMGKENDSNGPAENIDAIAQNNAFMCAVEEVVENTLFDHENEQDSDGDSVQSDDSSKAYEYWEQVFGPDEADGVDGEVAIFYDLFEDNTDVNAVEKSLEVKRGKVIMDTNPKPTVAKLDSVRSFEDGVKKSQPEHFSEEKLIDDVPQTPQSPTQMSKKRSFRNKRKSAQKNAEIRRPILGRLRRRFRVKKREKKSAVNQDFEMKKSQSFNKIFHKQSSLEIELKEGVDFKSNEKEVDESYEYFEDFDDPIEIEKQFDRSLNVSRESNNSSKVSFEDTSGEGDDTFEKEMKEINKLFIPWTASSFIEYFSSIIAISLISSYMSVASMICYSYVWFIIDAAFLYPGALYNSLYKHVNNSVAGGDDDGYFKAGKYIRVCIIINLIISIPASIAIVFGMGSIFRFYGFGEAMIELSHGYTLIAVIHNVLSYTSSFITITTDIDGYADFNAKYTFFDSIVDIALSVFVIPVFRPTLVQLGLIHLAHDIVSTAFYYFLTWYRWGWYDSYKSGMKSPITFSRKDKKAISTLLKKSIPMTLDALNGELEWLVSAYFASFLGSAESASWILLSYIWGLIGVVPGCIASAAECRVANQLSKGNIELSKQVASRCMTLTGITALIGTATMFVVRHPLIKVFTSDFYLSKMLIDVVPYLVLCQPLIALTTTAAYLNRALAMYKRSTKIELLITCLVSLPMAYVSTFIYGWDISGLAAASFIGYATMGAVILAIYNNADWEKAVRKNMKMAGTVESSKLDISIETSDTQDMSSTSVEKVGVMV